MDSVLEGMKKKYYKKPWSQVIKEQVLGKTYKHPLPMEVIEKSGSEDTMKYYECFNFEFGHCMVEKPYLSQRVSNFN